MAFLLKFFGVVAVIFLLLLIGASWYGYHYLSTYLKGSEAIELRLDGGTVYVRDQDWRQVTENTPLKPRQSVKTQDGSATIVFFGATLLRLDANTEVQLMEVNETEAKVIIKQENGKTWNRVIKAANKPFNNGSNVKGLREYEVQLPTAVATVRGTAFSTDAKGSISVVEGKVGVSAGGKQALVENATAVIGKTITLKPLNDKDPWIQKNRQKDSNFDADMAAQIKNKYKSLVEMVKQRLGDKYQKAVDLAKRKGISEEQIDQEIEQAFQKILGT